MADRDPILAAVDLLAPAFAEGGLDELEVEVGDLRVRLARPPAVSAEPPAAVGRRAASAGAGERRPHPVRRARARACASWVLR